PHRSGGNPWGTGSTSRRSGSCPSSPSACRRRASRAAPTGAKVSYAPDFTFARRVRQKTYRFRRRLPLQDGLSGRSRQTDLTRAPEGLADNGIHASNLPGSRTFRPPEREGEGQCVDSAAVSSHVRSAHSSPEAFSLFFFFSHVPERAQTQHWNSRTSLSTRTRTALPSKPVTR